jgi:hypothetical protein
VSVAAPITQLPPDASLVHPGERLVVPERIERRDAFALAILALIGVGVPLWLSAAAGTIGTPSNDDFVYIRAADALFHTGRIEMPGHFAASIGQIFMVQPILSLSAGSHWAFTAFGLAMALIAIIATYLLARRFVGTGSAIMAVLLMEAFPGMARESATFMTDVPAYALTSLCLLLGVRWLQKDGGRLTLAASLGTGLLAVSIREFAIAAPVAVLVAAWAQNRVGERVWVLAASGAFVAGFIGITVVSASIPGRSVPTKLFFGDLLVLGSDFATLAAVLLPAVALGIAARMKTLRIEQFLVAAGLVTLGVFLPNGSFVGDLWTPLGLGSDLLLHGDRALVIGAGVWVASNQIGLFAAILLATLIVRWAERQLARVNSPSMAIAQAIQLAQTREAPLVLFLLACGAEIAVLSPIVYPLDRYLYPMVPLAAILVLRRPAQAARLGPSHAASHAAFAWLAATAFVIAVNSFAYDSARWRAGEAAVAMGYDAPTVDAGYEWDGYHASAIANPGDSDVNLTFSGERWLLARACAVLSNSPLHEDGLTLINIDQAAYRQYLFFGPLEPLYLYGSVSDGCPTPPVSASPSVAIMDCTARSGPPRRPQHGACA